MTTRRSKKQQEQLDGYLEDIMTTNTETLVEQAISTVSGRLEQAQADLVYWENRAHNAEARLNLAESVIDEIASWNTVDLEDLRGLAKMYQRERGL